MSGLLVVGVAITSIVAYAAVAGLVFAALLKAWKEPGQSHARREEVAFDAGFCASFWPATLPFFALRRVAVAVARAVLS